MNNLKSYLSRQAQTVNEALELILPPEITRPARLHEAMRYSMFSGGKRLRPVLCIAASEACGGTAKQALPAACALELLHTYTLIHDDLPAMDDDTLRRGHPTCHIAFDEATAILAGDALLTLAFEVLAGIPILGSSLAVVLAQAAGSRGVIGGQAEDLAAEGQAANADLVDTIHLQKTAALIRAACVMGGICAQADENALRELACYGEAIGLAFQITDDLLDDTATVEELGKDIGSDRARGKMTYPAVHGTEQARRRTEELIQEAKEALKRIPGDTSILEELAGSIAGRKS